MPKVGLEIEVPLWNNNKLRNMVCDDLMGAGFMAREGRYNVEQHRYHCDCPTCLMWTRQNAAVPYPIQVHLQFDASLPASGGEFITSPFVVNDVFMENMRAVYNMICSDAVWTMQLPTARNDRPTSSPSIHIHSSSTNPNSMLDPTDIRGILWRFVPELFAMAASCGLDRGLEYRLPTMGGHHSFMNSIRGNGRGTIRFEWRMFEAAYQDWDYVSGAIYMASAATQFAQNGKVFSILDSMARFKPWMPEEAAAYGEPMSDTRQVLEHYSSFRMDVLEKALYSFTYLRYDPNAERAVRSLIDSTRRLFE